MNDQKPKILVGIPYHEQKRYAAGHMLDCVERLTYPTKNVVMRFDNGEYGGKDNVKKQREFFRSLALIGGFDYLYFLGVDTIPPDDVLERLLSTAEKNNIKIIGGVYWGRHNAENGNTNNAVAWINGMPLEERSELFKKPKTLLQVDGMGMDCVLIHRDVLEKISFLSWEQNDDDYPFYDKAKELGFDVYIDTDVQCRHFFTENGFSHLGEKRETIA